MLISCPRGKCSEFPAVSLLVDSLKWNLSLGWAGKSKDWCALELSIGLAPQHENLKTLLRMEVFMRLVPSALEMWESCLRKWTRNAKQKVKRPLRMCSNVQACIISTKWPAGGFSKYSHNHSTCGETVSTFQPVSTCNKLLIHPQIRRHLPDQFSTVALNCKAQTYNYQPSNYKYDQIRHGKAWQVACDCQMLELQGERLKQFCSFVVAPLDSPSPTSRDRDIMTCQAFSGHSLLTCSSNGRIFKALLKSP